MSELWARVDDFISAALVPGDPALDGAIERSAAAGLPPIGVAPNQGKFLQLLARLVGARNILEVGTLGGYSTIWLARALPADGRMLTLELEPHHAKIARANIAAAELADRVEVRVGPAIDTLATLVRDGHSPFDFTFIDADKANTPAYLTAAIALSRIGSLIVIDNAVRKGSIVDAGTGDPNVEGIRQTYEMLAAEPRVSATALQTVGVKGYDGLIVALVVAT